MYRHDYILRLIERFGRILIALRNRILRREVEVDDVRVEIREIAEQAGLDLEVARRLDEQTLLMWLDPLGEVDPARFWLLAELLYIEGLQARTAELGDRGRADFVRARALFAQLPPEWKPSDDLASAGERAVELQAMLD